MLPTSVKVRPLAAASRRSNRTRNHRDINKWHSAARVHSPAMSHKHPHDFGQGETARSREPSLEPHSKPSRHKQVAQRLTAWTHRHYRDQGSADLRSLGHLLVDLRASVPLRDVPRGEVLSVCLSVACIRLCREERYCPSEGLCGVLVWNCGVFRSGGCGLSTRPHRPHELSSIPNGLVFLSDCSLTAVCADARLCEQLLPATATLQDLTHCPERSAG